MNNQSQSQLYPRRLLAPQGLIDAGLLNELVVVEVEDRSEVTFSLTVHAQGLNLRTLLRLLSLKMSNALVEKREEDRRWFLSIGLDSMDNSKIRIRLFDSSFRPFRDSLKAIVDTARTQLMLIRMTQGREIHVVTGYESLALVAWREPDSSELIKSGYAITLAFPGRIQYKEAAEDTIAFGTYLWDRIRELRLGRITGVSVYFRDDELLVRVGIDHTDYRNLALYRAILATVIAEVARTASTVSVNHQLVFRLERPYSLMDDGDPTESRDSLDEMAYPADLR